MVTVSNLANRNTAVFDKPLILFFALAYLIAWGTLGVLQIVAQQSGVESGVTLITLAESNQLTGLALTIPAWLVYLLTRLIDFSFSIAGVVMIAVTAGRAGMFELWQRLTRWQIGWKWLVIGLLPIGLYGLATAVSGAIPSVTLTGETIRTALFSLHAGFFVSLFLRGAFGEELGLRGFALPRLQEKTSPFWASMIIGVLWGAWHLPVLLGRDVLSIVAFAILSLGLSFLFTLLFNGSGQSLIPVLLFHATQNWEEGFETLFPALVGTEWELASTLILLLVGIIAGVLVWRNGRTKAPKTPLKTFLL